MIIKKIKKIWIIGPTLVKLNNILRLNYYVRHIKTFFFMPFAIPVILLIRAIKPIIYIRFRVISTSEIGHFVADAGLLLCESVLDNTNIKDLYWLRKPVSNSQIEKMVKRVFYIRWWVKYLYIANIFIPGGKKHSLPSPRYLSGSRDTKGLLYKTRNEKKTYLPFIENEQTEARKFLEKLGLKEFDKFVCLLVRDSDYKNTFQPNRDVPEYWNYHNHRNSEIHTYAKGAVALAEKGYWVFRMGKYVLKPFNCKHAKVIDYAVSDEKNDFLDIWLKANCSFCITTSTGLDEVPIAFRKPLVMLNNIPVGDIASYTSAISYFKQLRWKKNNKKLTLKEYINNNYWEYQKYSQNGINIIDLTEDEIKNVVLEMEQRFSGTWKDNMNDIQLQNKFWQIYDEFGKSENTPSKSRCFVHPEHKISATFLRNNTEWLV